MSGYSNILMAIDLNDDVKTIYNRAKSTLATGGKLSMLHIMNKLDSAYFGAAPYAPVLVNAQDLEDETIELKKEHFNEISESIGLASEHTFFEIGKPASNIKEFALENKCDLIVVGSHGKHGLGLLLGSTANAVLHGAPCDVLAVRVDYK